MAFLPQFSKYFTAQERETEMFKLWSSIGVNTEKALSEEFEKIITQVTDINGFTESTVRSWLAFFLQKTPYITTSKVQVTTKLADSSGSSQVIIPKYSQLRNDEGYIYTTWEEAKLSGDIKRTVTAIQGRLITETQKASSIIKIQAKNPDLSYLTVSKQVGNRFEEIPPVSFTTSYDQLSFIGSWKPQNEDGKTFGGTPQLQNSINGVSVNTKGQFYTVIADGNCKFAQDGVYTEFKVGDLIVFDGDKWQRSISNNNLQPIQVGNSYAIPRNGYYAYYFNGFLYIKIYNGTEVSVLNTDTIQVQYISSDGTLGETKANTLSYVSRFENNNNEVVELEVENLESTPAVNEPSIGRLFLYLKQRLYSSINVSSVPEYTAWFKAQPEVGDCLVISDWERYLNAKSKMSDPTQAIYTSSGWVDIYLVDNNGDPIDSENPIWTALQERIEEYKDIAAIRVQEFKPVCNYFDFQYIDVNTTDEEFESFIKSTVKQFYYIPYLQSSNSSLFSGIDLANMIDQIQSNVTYKSTGLIVKGYHYFESERIDSGYALSKETYEGDKVGSGYYIVNCYNNENSYVGSFSCCENLNPNLSASDILVTGWAASGLTNIVVGSHTTKSNSSNGEVSFNANALWTRIDAAFQSYSISVDHIFIECYWGVEEEGFLPLGAFDGIRSMISKNIDLTVGFRGERFKPILNKNIVKGQ